MIRQDLWRLQKEKKEKGDFFPEKEHLICSLNRLLFILTNPKD